MSAFVKLSSRLPGDPETNGVDAMADQLVADPSAIRYAVVWFDISKITDETDTGNMIPTLRVRRLEPMGLATDVPPALAQLVADAFQARTGRAPMPFAMVEVQEGEDDPRQLTFDDAADAGLPLLVPFEG